MVYGEDKWVETVAREPLAAQTIKFFASVRDVSDSNLDQILNMTQQFLSPTQANLDFSLC